MRITVVGPTHPFKGGIAQHTAALARELAARGHQGRAELVPPHPARLYPGQLTIDAPEFPVHVPTRRVLSWNRPDSWWRVGRAARHSDVIVIAHVNPIQVIPYRILLAGAHAAGKKVVLAHNVLPHERSKLDKKLVTTLFNGADEIVTHSEAEQDLAAGLTSTAVAMSPIAPFMPPGFTPTHPLPESTRLLVFGIVRPYKGLDVALRALARGPADVRLRIAGEFWGGTSDTVDLIAELGLTDRVEPCPAMRRRTRCRSCSQTSTR